MMCNKFSFDQCTEPHTIFISYVWISAAHNAKNTLFLQTSIKHASTEASSCSLKNLIVWFLWVLQPSHTCHLLLCSHSSPRTTTTIGCHLSTSLRCDCQDVFSLSKKDFVFSQTSRPLLSPSACQDEAGTLGPSVAPALLWHAARQWSRSCRTPGDVRGLAGAGLRGESAVERLWQEFSGSIVLNNYWTMGQQRLGPNGSGSRQTADTPTPGTKADKQSQRPYYSLSLPFSNSHFWVALNRIHRYSPNLIF